MEIIPISFFIKYTTSLCHNLMETHFPYHIAPTFKLSGDGIFGKINEVISLYNLVNQTFIIKGEPNIKPKAFTLLRQRQHKAWQAIASDIDSFCQELHQGTDCAWGPRQPVASAIKDPAESCLQLHHDFPNKILAFTYRKGNFN